jgi:apolipoprotein N-acyltransferase
VEDREALGQSSMSFSLSLWLSSLRNILTTGLPWHVLAYSAMFSAPGFKAHKQLFGLFDTHYMNHRSQVLFSFRHSKRLERNRSWEGKAVSYLESQMGHLKSIDDIFHYAEEE